MHNRSISALAFAAVSLGVAMIAMPLANASPLPLSATAAKGAAQPAYTIQVWRVTAVSAGGYACGIAHDGSDSPPAGSLWCWGNNSVGQLGLGSQGQSADVSAPYEVGSLTTWRSVSVGLDHACAIRADTTMWCWGNNAGGELGNGTTTSSPSPVQVIGSGWTQSAAGFGQTCATKNDGTLWCWGANASGQLGVGDLVNRATPVQVGSASSWASVVAGGDHGCAIQSTGSLWCWGTNAHGEVGDGVEAQQTTPVKIGGAHTSWMQVSAGDKHTCGIQQPPNNPTKHTLWCWGDDGVNAVHQTPSRINTSKKWASVSAGSGDTCGIQTGNTLWCWGVNVSGQLGQGDTTARTAPTQITFRLGWAQVSDGGGQTCVLRLDTTMWCFGFNDSGQLGDHGRTPRFLPTPIIATAPWIAVSDGGGSHTCGISDLQPQLNYLYCWGVNDHGQLGDTTTITQSLPEHIGNLTWTAIDGGESFTCGIQKSANGTLWCWGANDQGQLGIGNTTEAHSPQQVGGSISWLSIGTGDDHACGIQQPGTLWCWGNNADGEVGNGTTTDALSPVQVGAVSSWASVSAGAAHTCAIKGDGTLWCWGDNSHGELGDGTAVDRDQPVQVGGDNHWATVNTGGQFTCATKTDSTLWCWGVNDHGQSGQAAGADITTPAQVGAQSAWATVSSGLDHSCATQTTLTLWCWGNERFGDLGDGIPTGEQDAPTRWIYQKGDPWGLVHVYDDSTCGIKAFMECVGADGVGQLGDGSPSAYKTMPSVVVIIPA